MTEEKKDSKEETAEQVVGVVDTLFNWGVKYFLPLTGIVLVLMLLLLFLDYTMTVEQDTKKVIEGKETPPKEETPRETPKEETVQKQPTDNEDNRDSKVVELANSMADIAENAVSTSGEVAQSQAKKK